MAGLANRYDQRPELERLVTELAEIGSAFPGLEAYLFGSRAKGDYVDSSDFDLVLVSPAFSGISFLRRGGEILWRLAQHGIGKIDLLCYTPDEAAAKRSEPGAFASALAASRRLL